MLTTKTITFDEMPAKLMEIYTLVNQMATLLPTLQQQDEGRDDVLVLDDAAALLHISKGTLYSMVSKRAIPFTKLGKRLYFSRKKLQLWLVDKAKPALYN